MKIMKHLSTLLLMITLVGCDYQGPIKPGYEAVTLPESEKMTQLEAKLSKAKIDHYVYTDQSDGKNYIAYPSKYSNEVEVIIEKLYGRQLPYKNTKSLCFNTEKEQKYMDDALSNKKIKFTNGTANQSFCVYWPAEEDKKVEDAYQPYHAVKEACKQDPRCKL